MKKLPFFIQTNMARRATYLREKRMTVRIIERAQQRAERSFRLLAADNSQIPKNNK